MTNIAELLKDAPKDLKLYSPICGHCKLSCILHDDGIRVIAHDVPFRFDKYGRFCSADDAECLLFPSKDCRTWEGWKAPKSHYDISNFHAGMPVLVRDYNNSQWSYVQFSHLIAERNVGEECGFKFNACGIPYIQCIPFNDDTKHLLGTTDMCPEEYVNW